MRLPTFLNNRRVLLGAGALAVAGFALGAIVNQGIGRALRLPEDTDVPQFTDAGAPAPSGDDEGDVPVVAATEEPAQPRAGISRPRGLSARQYADIIVRRNIFDSSAVYDPNAVVAGGGDCKADSSVRLVATVVADPAEYSSALLAVGGKEGQADGFVIGDEVSGEGRIVSIEQKRVCTDGGTCFCMGTDSTLAPVVGDKALASADDGGGVTDLGGGRYQVDPSVLESALGNVEMLATQMRVVPHKGTDGQVDGYRVSSIKKNSLFSKLGIQNGDVVHGVNGQPLTSAEGALATYQALKSERSFSFEISRKNQRQTLQYEVR
jgi:general secretion pathway protein C